MTMDELDPSTKREMETIATLQNASTQDIGWILEDLSYYKSRTGERIYSDLYNQMSAFSLREKLDLVHGNILNAITARSIDESRLYASTLRHWAKLIDDYKKSRGGGGGSGGGDQASISDAEFEFMLKIIRMIDPSATETSALPASVMSSGSSITSMMRRTEARAITNPTKFMEIIIKEVSVCIR